MPTTLKKCEPAYLRVWEIKADFDASTLIKMGEHWQAWDVYPETVRGWLYDIGVKEEHVQLFTREYARVQQLELQKGLVFFHR